MIFRRKTLRFLGVVQVVLGTLMIVFGILQNAIVEHWSSQACCGIWIGIWVVLIGHLAFYVGKHGDSSHIGLIGVLIAFAVFGCVCVIGMIAMLGIAFDPFSKRLKCSRYLPPPTNISSDYCYQTYGGYQNSITYVDAQAGVTLGSLLIILGVVELIVALASSIYGCQSCRCNVPAGQAHRQVAYLQQPDGSVIAINAYGSVLPGATVQNIRTYPG